MILILIWIYAVLVVAILHFKAKGFFYIQNIFRTHIVKFHVFSLPWLDMIAQGGFALL